MPTAPAPTLLFENAAGRVEADPAGYVRSHWGPGPRTLTDTQEFLQSITRALQQTGQHTVLSNQTAMPPITPEEQVWVAEHWLPQAVHEAGYRACAIVVATNTFSRLSMAYVTTSVGDLAMRYRSFDSEADATAWLLKQG